MRLLSQAELCALLVGWDMGGGCSALSLHGNMHKTFIYNGAERQRAGFSPDAGLHLSVLQFLHLHKGKVDIEHLGEGLWDLQALQICDGYTGYSQQLGSELAIVLKEFGMNLQSPILHHLGILESLFPAHEMCSFRRMFHFVLPPHKASPFSRFNQKDWFFL